MSIYNSLAHTHVTPRVKVLKGMFPMVMYFGAWGLAYAFSDWAWDNAGFMTLLSAPTISLINSRQIVCNVTHMPMSCVPKVTLWYLPFPLNRLLPTLLDLPSSEFARDGTPLLMCEAKVAWIILVITTVWYLHFAVGTVRQICGALDIYCFTIKKQKNN